MWSIGQRWRSDLILKFSFKYCKVLILPFVNKEPCMKHLGKLFACLRRWTIGWFEKKRLKESYGAVVLDDDLLVVPPNKGEDLAQVGATNNLTLRRTFDKFYDQMLDELCKI